jgi:uncharacterized protein YacL
VIIEAVRLVVTLGATAAGFIIGRGAPAWTTASSPDAAAIVGAVIGAGVGYVLGGLTGRLVRKAVEHAPAAVERASGPELFAGAFGFVAGLFVGAIAAVPAVALLPEPMGWSVGALLVIVLSSLGWRVFSARSEDLLVAAGLRRWPKDAPDDERTFVIDTSAAIDGRVLDLARSGLMNGRLRVASFVLEELQGIADRGEGNHRRRGRRGLDVLDALSSTPGVELRIDERTFPEFPEVDAKLIAMAVDAEATLVTTDHNLGRVAALRGVPVLNLQSLGESLRGLPVTGDTVALTIEKVGTEPGQGVGYLDDGTMVVVEGAASLLGEQIEIEIASALRTSVGRLLFGRLAA